MLSPNIPEPFDHQQAARNAIGLEIGREFQALLSSYAIGCLDCYSLNQEELWNLSTLMRELQSLLEVRNDFQTLEQWLNSGFLFKDHLADSEILLPQSSAASAGIDSAFSSSQLELEEANPRLSYGVQRSHDPIRNNESSPPSLALAKLYPQGQLYPKGLREGTREEGDLGSKNIREETQETYLYSEACLPKTASLSGESWELPASMRPEDLGNLSTLMTEIQSLLEVRNDVQALEQWLNSGFVLEDPAADNEILLPISSAASAGIDSAFSSSLLEPEKVPPRLSEKASSWKSRELPAPIRQDDSLELVRENISTSQLEAPMVKNLKDLVQRLALEPQGESSLTSASVNLLSDRLSEVDIAEGNQTSLLNPSESPNALSAGESARVSLTQSSKLWQSTIPQGTPKVNPPSSRYFRDSRTFNTSNRDIGNSSIQQDSSMIELPVEATAFLDDRNDKLSESDLDLVLAAISREIQLEYQRFYGS